MGDEYGLLQVPAWIDLLAIAAGALSGAAGAVRPRFDLIGVLLVAILMGLGGGIIRDVLLGLRPVAVTNQSYLITAVAAGLGSMLLLTVMTRWVQLFSLFDALALALFTIVGVEKAVLYGAPVAGAVFIGVSAAVGGGVFRDIISGQPVEIVRRGSWNAAAALVGAVLFVALRTLPLPVAAAEATAFAVIVGVRYCSLHFGWQTAEAGDLLAKVTRGRITP
ncbi:MAG: TRIC cation channel family protein [Propionicimonas sp.]|uniref:trimeric intracellular cation channel family protein n=1 Tax=Propionicimonas sp. TaxID=1955623 RepID=UPI003D0E02A8